MACSGGQTSGGRCWGRQGEKGRQGAAIWRARGPGAPGSTIINPSRAPRSPQTAPPQRPMATHLQVLQSRLIGRICGRQLCQEPHAHAVVGAAIEGAAPLICVALQHRGQDAQHLLVWGECGEGGSFSDLGMEVSNLGGSNCCDGRCSI